MRRLACVVGIAAALFGLVPATAQAAEAAPPPNCPSLEGCYSYSNLQQFYGQVIGLVNDFSSATYKAMPRPRYWFVYGGRVSTTPCGNADSRTAFSYCEADRTVYVGQDQLWEFYQMDGDGAAAFAVAHEWGHFVQHRSGVFNQSQTQQVRIREEDQADCVGGAFLGYLRDRNILEADDYDDVNAILPQIASSENDPNRDHGTLEERDRSAQYGLDHGIRGCSAFFPSKPLVT